MWARVTLWETEEVQVHVWDREQEPPRCPPTGRWRRPSRARHALPSRGHCWAPSCASGCLSVRSASSGADGALLWPWLSQDKSHQVCGPHLLCSASRPSAGSLDPIGPELGVALHLRSHWWVVPTATHLPQQPRLTAVQALLGPHLTGAEGSQGHLPEGPALGPREGPASV